MTHQQENEYKRFHHGYVRWPNDLVQDNPSRGRRYLDALGLCSFVLATDGVMVVWCSEDMMNRSAFIQENW